MKERGTNPLKRAAAMVAGRAVGMGCTACVRPATESAAVAITDVRVEQGQALAVEMVGSVSTVVRPRRRARENEHAMAGSRPFRFPHATDGSASARAALASPVVSRAVCRRAAMPVLVVRRERRGVAHLVVGFDGSAAADRAVRFLARGTVTKGGMAGWRVRGQARVAATRYELLRRADEARANALVAGATAQGSTRKGLLGSATEGAVSRSAVPVLVVP